MPILPHVFGDHPRGCGAHGVVHCEECSERGSSPRVRGSLSSCLIVSSLSGIIPAGAGLTILPQSPPCQTGDHPRGCGAHLTISMTFMARTGSSPRVRGSRENVFLLAVGHGIIPAGAGLTLTILATSSLLGDHPRGCGAHQHRIIRATSGTGSSPRVRGSHTSLKLKDLTGGIIPAGAGLTAMRTHQNSGRWDHPRGCGAHGCYGRYFHKWRGSSPRVRGSPYSLHLRHIPRGIIPAGAGLTTMGVIRIAQKRDHPRGCGAHKCNGKETYNGMGSSPRVRGSLPSVQRPALSNGIIPAGAGLTEAQGILSRSAWDHPRGCGAH